MAMVITNRPRLLLYDEPIAGISSYNIPKIKQFLDYFHNDGVTMIILEHRIKEIIGIADRIIRFDLGQVYIK